MSCSKLFLALAVVSVVGHTGIVTAEDSPIGKDLGATIALQGMPCDKVVEAKRNGDSDYTATCKDGNHYHVFVDPNGRVVVKKI
jgi:hypothetical protein